jgi:hypothetical protein
MYQDDAEDRVAEPGQPQPANTAPEKPRRKSLSTGLLLVAFGVGILAYGAQFAHGYWVGTPTTATVTHCHVGGLFPKVSEGSRTYCDGTWNVVGQSQSGPIKPSFGGGDGDNHEQRGSTLNVHVSDGKAYWLSKILYIWMLSPILVVWGSVNLWRRRRERNRE